MTWQLKHKPLPGSPMLVDYDCEPCELRFEEHVQRDTNGDPPSVMSCPECDEPAQRVFGAPAIKFWTRAVVAINPAGSTRHDEPDPRALDTRPLAEGKMTRKEWRTWQAGITQERRHQSRLKAGKISKRIQVGGG
ncbi:MAG TPA: hypothetical protein VHZ95_02950 [Polyangiales bacterium]|jgi:hypothetical protein|nr:hypothetical protein [Polyangiales bacterium]